MMSIEKILAIAKNRGFFYPGSEIHSAIAGFWHYGPVGTIFKNKQILGNYIVIH